MDLDFNGILKITAIEKNTGKQITGVIENAFSEISQDNLSASKSKIDKAWESQGTLDTTINDSDEQKALRLKRSKRSSLLLPGIGMSLKMFLPKIDSEEIINLIEDILFYLE